MRKSNRIERRVWWINIAYLSSIMTLTIILAVRFTLCGGCSECFTGSLANGLLLYALTALCFGYIACIPIMIYKVRQSKKVKVDDDCDEGSCSY